MNLIKLSSSESYTTIEMYVEQNDLYLINCIYILLTFIQK